ncbi:UNVERIFIED_CONTAM: hypothetical protein Sindi_0016700 [Sesamum indicum]
MWKGTSTTGYPKVSWTQVCRSIEEDGQGLKNLTGLNLALMTQHIWKVVTLNPDSISISWINSMRLRGKSIWTVDAKSGAWAAYTFVVGDGEMISLWHDLWHPLGPLINMSLAAPHLHARDDLLRVVIQDGEWHWPRMRNTSMLDITRHLSPISGVRDSIFLDGGSYANKIVYDIFRHPGPKVGWSSLLMGPFKPQNTFILWLALHERLSTMDLPWLYLHDSVFDCCDVRSASLGPLDDGPSTY